MEKVPSKTQVLITGWPRVQKIIWRPKAVTTQILTQDTLNMNLRDLHGPEFVGLVNSAL